MDFPGNPVVSTSASSARAVGNAAGQKKHKKTMNERLKTNKSLRMPRSFMQIWKELV